MTDFADNLICCYYNK